MYKAANHHFWAGVRPLDPGHSFASLLLGEIIHVGEDNPVANSIPPLIWRFVDNRGRFSGWLHGRRPCGTDLLGGALDQFWNAGLRSPGRPFKDFN
jgi:hypothetical protein